MATLLSISLSFRSQAACHVSDSQLTFSTVNQLTFSLFSPICTGILCQGTIVRGTFVRVPSYGKPLSGYLCTGNLCQGTFVRVRFYGEHLTGYLCMGNLCEVPLYGEPRSGYLSTGNLCQGTFVRGTFVCKLLFASHHVYNNVLQFFTHNHLAKL